MPQGKESPMSAIPEHLAKVPAGASRFAPFPNSRKVYITGSRPDIRVPMREVRLSDTPASFGAEPNAPVYLYDTSGPYTDPGFQADLRGGLPELRGSWIDERGDTERLAELSSEFGRRRLADGRLASLRFPNVTRPRRARSGSNV